MNTALVDAATDEQVEELAARVFGAVLGSLEMATVALGVELGLYAALDREPGLTPAELADRCGLSVRYAIEWLQSQAISGLLAIEGEDVATARFRLIPGLRETLVDASSPAFVGALVRVPAIVGRVEPDLVAAYRSGAGVPYVAYGPEAVAAQEGLNRPAFEHALVQEWLPQLPQVLARLSDTEAATRVADVACGAGWSTIRLAEAFPHLHIDGLDADETSIIAARRNAAARGVDDRTHFEVVDLTEDPASARTYDVVFMFEALHDLSQPKRALHTLRNWLAPEGTLIVMDENAAAELAAPGDEVERFLAAVSAVWCTPQGMGPDSEVIGAVMRPATLVRLASDAGFGEVTVAPIEHPFFRFWELRH